MIGSKTPRRPTININEDGLLCWVLLKVFFRILFQSECTVALEAEASEHWSMRDVHVRNKHEWD